MNWRDLLSLIAARQPENGLRRAEEPALDSSRDESVDRMEFLLSLRRRGISDQAVLRAIDAVPREKFVLAEFADAAYADQAMPIACGQTISQPYVVAYMTEHAPYDRIMVTAAAEAIPQKLVDELAEDGVMVLPLGEHGGPQRIVKLTRAEGGVTRQDLIWVRFVPLLPGQAREL
jgi:protein-L-isoaspartate O-methyltransferase